MTSRITTPSPGQLLRQELQERGWTQKELSQRCGCSPGAITRLISDRSPVSPAMDLKLSLVLGTPHAKLTEAQAIAIRQDTRTYAEIASDYGVNQATVGKIKTGKTWRHLAQ